MEAVKRLFSTVKQYRWRSLFAVVAMVVIGVGLAQPTQAIWWGDPIDSVVTLVSLVLYFLLIYVMGILATTASDVLVYTAQLTNFTDLAIIVEAWSVVRDLANMFFIVILLVIAFGTLFRLEAYSWKKLLPKMVLAAILMNYSRAICGFIVDASQVVMLTFVAAIKDAASVGLAEAFNLSKLLQFDTELKVDPNGNPSTAQSRLVAIVAAGFMLATMFTVQCVYIVVLVGRLVMIWFLTVLSPLAYVTKVLPATERYASQWWEMFGRYVVVGPMCMFFLWLAMFIAAKSVAAGGSGLGSIAASAELTIEQDQTLQVIDAQALDPTLISGFVIATLMLMAGMKMALENSSELGEYTGKVSSLAKGLTAVVGITAGAKAISYLNDRQFSATGVDLNAVRVKDRWKHGLEKNKKDRVMEGESVASQKYREGYLLAGVTGAGDQVAELGPKPEQLRGGLVGNIPLLRNWKGARQSWFGGKQGAFEKAMDQEQTLKKESVKTEGEIDTLKKDSNLTTVEDFNKELANRSAGGNDVLDASNDAQRAILEQYQQALKEIAGDPSLTEAERKQASKAASGMQKAISSKSGTINLNGPAFKGAGGAEFNDLIASTKAKAKANADELTKDDAFNKRTKNGTLNNKDDINNALMQNADYAKLMKRQEQLLGAQNADGDRPTEGGELGAVKKNREQLGSLMGSGGELKLRKLIDEAAGSITSEDTAELCDGFKDAMHKGSGFGPEALAYFDRLAATNNVNDLLSDPAILEMLQKIDPSIGDNAYSMEGMQALEKLMIKQFKLPQQAVRSTMHRGFQHMKKAGNTFMSEQTEVKNGQYTWRSPEDWQNVALIESRKRNTKNQLSSATRLQLGDGKKYYKQQDFTLKNLGSLVSTSLNTDKSLTLNPDIVRHLSTDSKRYVVMRNEIIKTVKDTKLRKEALKAFNDAIRKGGVDLASSADDDKLLNMTDKVY